MNIVRNYLLFSSLILVSSFSSCDKEPVRAISEGGLNANPPHTEIIAGTDKNIFIRNVSYYGDIVASHSDTGIVKTFVSNSSLTVFALKPGETTVRVKDPASEKYVNIPVTVLPDTMEVNSMSFEISGDISFEYNSDPQDTNYSVRSFLGNDAEDYWTFTSIFAAKKSGTSITELRIRVQNYTAQIFKPLPYPVSNNEFSHTTIRLIYNSDYSQYNDVSEYRFTSGRVNYVIITENRIRGTFSGTGYLYENGSINYNKKIVLNNGAFNTTQN